MTENISILISIREEDSLRGISQQTELHGVVKEPHLLQVNS